MASSYKKPHMAKQLAVVRAGHAREKHQSDPNAVTLSCMTRKTARMILC